jgi:hypothetical protein
MDLGEKAMALLMELVSVVTDVLPILAVIFFFQYVVIRKRLPQLPKIALGILFVVLGLYAFIVGLEMGLFPIGETMALQLTQQDNRFFIYLFAFLIGFSTTMAEPALLAIALKVEEISAGKIRQIILRVAVALGVAVGIALGAYRIVAGDPIHYYIIAGYIIVIILTYFAPRYIIPIAYDSGGVTTSTVTVPLVAALGLGLATNIEGRSPLIDGFGLIAFASLFPMITVMGYGVITEMAANQRARSARKGRTGAAEEDTVPGTGTADAVEDPERVPVQGRLPVRLGWVRGLSRREPARPSGLFFRRGEKKGTAGPRLPGGSCCPGVLRRENRTARPCGSAARALKEVPLGCGPRAERNTALAQPTGLHQEVPAVRSKCGLTARGPRAERNTALAQPTGLHQEVPAVRSKCGLTARGPRAERNTALAQPTGLCPGGVSYN